MTPAEQILDDACQERDPTRADRLAFRASCLQPGLGAAYALRALLAARRGDPVVAAHHFRAAFARGDRTPETRVGLALCLSVAGQADLAQRVRAGLACPDALVDFEELVLSHGRPIQQVLSVRMPPDSEPALLPGESLPVDLRPRQTPQAASSAPARHSMPRLPTHPPGVVPPPKATPSLQTQPAMGALSLPRAPGLATEPPLPGSMIPSRRVARSRKNIQPEWLENIERTKTTSVVTAAPDWLEGTAPAVKTSGGRRFDASVGLELVIDPGAPEVLARSPITGQIDDPRDLDRHYRGASIGQYGSPGDVLEARGDFGPDVPASDFLVAARIPGPVMTAVGMAPKKLARWMAIGITATEMIMRDIESEPVRLVRLPLSAVTWMEIVGDGQQISLTLADARQLHLDLRNLRARAYRVAVEFVSRLTSSLESQ